MALGLAVAALLLHGWGVARSPDIFGDEGLYFLVARNLANGIGLYDDGGVFFWHPPAYPMLEAAFAWSTGAASKPFTEGLLDVRALNVLLSAATAGVLVLLGRRLHSLPVGALFGVLFVGDLFVQRINRRAMLETAAELLIVIGLYLFLRYRHDVRARTAVLIGAAFGLGILVKEIAAIGLLILVTFAVVFDRRLLPRVVAAAGVAASMWAVYAAWALSVDAERFIAFKIGAVTRILALGRGLVPREARVDLGANPGLLERLGPAIASYGPTYVALALGGLGLLVLWSRHREAVGAQLLMAWGATTYACIAIAMIAGLGDQFFYYAVVPAFGVIAYVFVAEWPVHRRWRVALPFTGRTLAISSVALAALLAYDGAVWAARYATARDDGYARLVQVVEATVPEGATIVAGADVSNFLLRPRYDIRFYRDPVSVRAGSVRYFILSSKEAAQRYNRMTPEFYDYVRRNTETIAEFEGETYWTLGLYRWLPPTTGHRVDDLDVALGAAR